MTRRAIFALAAALALYALAVCAFSPRKAPETLVDSRQNAVSGIIYSDGRALIDINSADEKLLCRIPGIGEKLAKRIAQYARSNGPFKTLNDLTQVEGIGRGKLKEMIDSGICGLSQTS